MGSGYAAVPYGKHLCKEAGYQCEKVRHRDTWRSRFADEKQRHLVKALNRTNRPLRYRRFIVVPDNLESLSNKLSILAGEKISDIVQEIFDDKLKFIPKWIIVNY